MNNIKFKTKNFVYPFMNPIINPSVMLSDKGIPRFCISDDTDDGAAVIVDKG
jgi:hypothetical protein